MDNEVFKVYKIVYTNQYRTNARVYEVSNLGRVRLNGEIVEPRTHNGYYIVAHEFVHRMIAKTFVENPENKPFVDHINANRTDNRACNLRWVTQAENNRNPLTRKHHSEAMRGKVLSAECKRKMSEARKGKPGKPHSEETKRKISEALKGKPNNFTGKHHSEESRSKISAALKGRHVKIVDGKRIWYD